MSTHESHVLLRLKDLLNMINSRFIKYEIWFIHENEIKGQQVLTEGRVRVGSREVYKKCKLSFNYY